MKIFEQNGKINFIDENNVFVGFDYQQSCCENFGYTLSTMIPAKGVVTPDLSNSLNFDVSDYRFDTKFYIEDSDHEYEQRVVFKLTNSQGEALFLTLYNHHNGYYGHGFEMTLNGENVRSGTL